MTTFIPVLIKPLGDFIRLVIDVSANGMKTAIKDFGVIDMFETVEGSPVATFSSTLGFRPDGSGAIGALKVRTC